MITKYLLEHVNRKRKECEPRGGSSVERFILVFEYALHQRTDTSHRDEVKVWFSVVTIPQVLYLTKDGRVYLVKILKFIEYDGEVTLKRFSHHNFKEIVEVCQTTIYLNVQLFFYWSLELTTKNCFTVLRYKEVCVLVSFERFRYKWRFANTPSSH